MRKLTRGFTLARLIFVIFWLAGLIGTVWLLSLVARALMKYIGI